MSPPAATGFTCGSGSGALAVIAKEPVAGAAKTRLIPALGAEGAARLAAAMLGDTLAMVRSAGASPWLCFTPAGARARLAGMAPGFGLLPQCAGDLGDRLADCLQQLLRRGAARAAIVGADTPHLPAALCRRAFALLDHADVALGPALDGGYYLVAAHASWPELFAGVPMGTDRVLRATLDRAAGLGLRVALLPALRDLDRIEDLHAALEGGELDRAPRTRAAAQELLALGDNGSGALSGPGASR
jgi:rSAM/selenodomain-associated transferase 1